MTYTTAAAAPRQFATPYQPRICTMCGSEMWDNRKQIREGAKSPSSPTFACKNRPACGHAEWATPKPTAQAPIMAAPTAPAPQYARPVAPMAPQYAAPQYATPQQQQYAPQAAEPEYYGEAPPSEDGGWHGEAAAPIPQPPTRAAMMAPAPGQRAPMATAVIAPLAVPAGVASAFTGSDRSLLEELANRFEARAHAAERSDRISVKAMASGLRDAAAQIDKLLTAGGFPA